MGNIGFGELVLILLILLMVFGAKRLPEIGRAIGRTVHEFKKGMHEGAEDTDDHASKQEQHPAGQA